MILAQATQSAIEIIHDHGMRNWSPGEWGMFLTALVAAIGTLLTITVLPFILRIFSALKELRESSVRSETKADSAVATGARTVDRVLNLAATMQPSAPSTPAAEAVAEVKIQSPHEKEPHAKTHGKKH